MQSEQHLENEEKEEVQGKNIPETSQPPKEREEGMLQIKYFFQKTKGKKRMRKVSGQLLSGCQTTYDLIISNKREGTIMTKPISYFCPSATF